MTAVNRLTFWWRLHTQTECMPEAVTGSRHLGLISQNLEKPNLSCGYFFVYSRYSSLSLINISWFCLHSLLPCTLMVTYSFWQGTFKNIYQIGKRPPPFQLLSEKEAFLSLSLDQLRYLSLSSLFLCVSRNVPLPQIPALPYALSNFLMQVSTTLSVLVW